MSIYVHRKLEVGGFARYSVIVIFGFSETFKPSTLLAVDIMLWSGYLSSILIILNDERRKNSNGYSNTEDMKLIS